MARGSQGNRKVGFFKFPIGLSRGVEGAVFPMDFGQRLADSRALHDSKTDNAIALGCPGGHGAAGEKPIVGPRGAHQTKARVIDIRRPVRRA